MADCFKDHTAGSYPGYNHRYHSCVVQGDRGDGTTCGHRCTGITACHTKQCMRHIPGTADADLYLGQDATGRVPVFDCSRNHHSSAHTVPYELCSNLYPQQIFQKVLMEGLIMAELKMKERSVMNEAISTQTEQQNKQPGIVHSSRPV